MDCNILQKAEGLYIIYLLCCHGNKPLLSYQQGPLETITRKVDPLYMEANIRMGYSTLYSVDQAKFYVWRNTEYATYLYNIIRLLKVKFFETQLISKSLVYLKLIIIVP